MIHISGSLLITWHMWMHGKRVPCRLQGGIRCSKAGRKVLQQLTLRPHHRALSSGSQLRGCGHRASGHFQILCLSPDLSIFLFPAGANLIFFSFGPII